MSQPMPADRPSPARHRLTRRTLLRGGLVLLPVVALGASRVQPTVDALGRQPAAVGATSSPVQDVPACVLTPQQTQGPYFVDEMLERSDIRVDPTDGSITEGAPLTLILNVSQVVDCAASPLVGAMVDVWHCDALGNYSDVRDMSSRSTAVGKKFLRGYQITDESGQVQFQTIYPGWYPGRAVHVHFKIRTALEGGSGHEFTSQLYFPDELSDQIYTLPPYAAKGTNPTRNERDGIFRNGGSLLQLQPVALDDGSYEARFDVGVDLAAPAAAIG